ncbi:STAS domain-containing protein [Nocardia takedensis]|uniref:STAS domain-containing protein n=1 Tax=Nocardia takedensis TaxID=259390 RepID=UPI001FDF115E|nr:STAS domain-containing protein [Nocardia takedensis]
MQAAAPWPSTATRTRDEAEPMPHQPPDFDVRRTATDSASVVTAVGEVDLFSAPRLRAALDDALAARPSLLVLDLSGVEFFDSSGLEVLLQVRGELGDVSLRLVASPAVRRPLRVTGLNRVFAVHDDLSAALADS